MSIPYIIQGKNIILAINNKSHTINPQHIGYQQIVDAMKANEWDKVKDLVEPKKILIKFANGNVRIDDGKFFWKDKEFNNILATKMMNMLREGFTIDPMVKFMENLMSNPSYRAVQGLYKFLENGKMPITSDGCLLAYKKVAKNYTDLRTGKFDNTIGSVVSMPRNEVDDDPNQVCSYGLHACSEEYLPNYGGSHKAGEAHSMIVKINPRDVVTIPKDYNHQKMRVCEYNVMGEVGILQDAADVFTSAVQDISQPKTHEVPKEILSAAE